MKSKGIKVEIKDCLFTTLSSKCPYFCDDFGEYECSHVFHNSPTAESREKLFKDCPLSKESIKYRLYKSTEKLRTLLLVEVDINHNRETI